MRLRTATQRESKRQRQCEPGQGKAKQMRSKNQLEKDKIRGGASEIARESSLRRDPLCDAPAGHHKAEFSPRSAATGRPSIDSRSTARRSPSKSKRAKRTHCSSRRFLFLCACDRGLRPRGAPCAAAVKGEPSPGPASKHTDPTAHACIKSERGKSDTIAFCDVPSQFSLSMPCACGPDLGGEMRQRWLDSVKERSSFDNVATGSTSTVTAKAFRF